MAKTAIEGASRLNAFLIEPEKLTIISDEKHALYDERIKLPIDEKLVLNIMAFNVKQPVFVAKDGNEIQVVDGRQRVRAALEANKRLVKDGKEPLRIPVMLQKGDDADLFGVSIFVNELRQSDGPLIKAAKAVRFLAMGRTEEEAAVVFGVTPAAIRQWVKLFDLAPQVRAAVNAGEITASAASKLAPLKKAEQVEELRKLTADGKKTTGKKAAVAAKKARGQVAIEKPSTKLLKRLIAYSTNNEKGIGDDDITLLKWVLGEIDAKEAGVVGILQEMEEAALEVKPAVDGVTASAG